MLLSKLHLQYLTKLCTQWHIRNYCKTIVTTGSLKEKTESKILETTNQKKLVKKDYTVVTPRMCDSDKISELLKRSFFKHEPLVVAAGCSEDPTGEVMDHCIVPLEEDMSLMAVSKDGEILGIAVNGCQIPNTSTNSELAGCKCPRTCELFKIWSHIEMAPDLGNRFGVLRVFELKILATAPEARGRGIGGVLMASSVAKAVDMKFQLIRVDCTSHYTAKACERLGFQCVYTMDYKDYVGDDGKPVFHLEPPHASAKVYILDLNL